MHRGAYFAELRTTTVSHVIWAAPGPVDWGLSSDLAEAAPSLPNKVSKSVLATLTTLTKLYPPHRCASSCPSPGASSDPSTPLPPPPPPSQVRKLLPESWGFFCPVHTPDGSPCGLLNHFTAACRIVTHGPDGHEEAEAVLVQV